MPACRLQLPYTVFVAYKGNNRGPNVACAVSRCINGTRDMRPQIALPSAPGQIQVEYGDEPRIFDAIARCDAFVVVNTKGASSTKFLDECSHARWTLNLPFVAVVEKGSRPRPPMNIKSRICQVRFNRWSSVNCRELRRVIRSVIDTRHGLALRSETASLPRRVLRA